MKQTCETEEVNHKPQILFANKISGRWFKCYEATVWALDYKKA